MLTMLRGLAWLTWVHNHCQEQSFECTHIKWTCASAYAHSHTHVCACTHKTKWALHLYLREVFVYFTTVVFESDLLCKFMIWRYLQDQKCGWSYSYCGSLKSKLLICSTGTLRLEGIRHTQIEIPVQFCGDLLVQLFWLISVFFAICSYTGW
jgi:hypothetical protein